MSALTEVANRIVRSAYVLDTVSDDEATERGVATILLESVLAALEVCVTSARRPPTVKR